MNYTIKFWWDSLKEKEKNVLIELLYNMDLKDFVETDAGGNYIKLIK